VNPFEEAAASTRLDGDTIDVGPVTAGTPEATEAYLNASKAFEAYEDHPDVVYRHDGMAVQRRTGNGTYVTIARGNTDDIASYIAAALNALAADGDRS
jgi:hypothetical protein